MSSDILIPLGNVIKNIDQKCEDQNTVEESNRLLIQFNKRLEDEQISSSVLGRYLLFIFNKDSGLTKFLSVVYSKKSFTEPIRQCLEIFYLLINNFPGKLRKYTKDINEVCLLILRASSASSYEKVKALSVIILEFDIMPINVEYFDHYVDIYNALLYSLTLKIGDSISEKAYECLGLYTKLFDSIVNDQEKYNLRNSMFFKIKQEMLKSDPSKKMITGLFNGLAHIFERSPFHAIEDKVKINELYKFVKNLADTTKATTTRTSSRAALIFLQQNMDLFGANVFCDHLFWHSTLIEWLTKLGEKEKKVSSKVILTVYLYITKQLIKEKKPEFKNILKKYLANFRKGLNKQDSTNLEKQTYIHGIRIFFEASPELFTATEISNFSTKVLHTFKSTYITNQDTSSDDWPLLPHFIQMITSIIITMGAQRNEITLLKQSLIVSLKTYHLIPILHRSAVVDAFLMALYSLHSKEMYDSFLYDLIYQSVIWSCSHSHVSELELNENNEKLVTVKDYMYFWNSICRMISDKRYDEWGMDVLMRRTIFLEIVQKLIITLFVSVNKLDVTMSTKDTNSIDIKDVFEINKKDDFAIFLNIVDFYEEIFNKINSEVLSKCIYKLLSFFMEKSSSSPMISGFYRLLAICLKVANDIEYFHSSVGEELTGPALECRQTLAKYMQELLPRILHFRDELLISSLKVLLECPPRVLKGILPCCVPVFIAIFTIGRNYMPVAALGISTLETWQKNLDADELEEFLCLVVPALDAFLRSKSMAYSGRVNQKRIKTSRALAKRKMVVEIEPELVKLQRRMLRFVGRQSTKVCERIIDCPRVITDVWGADRHLKITMPFKDFKLNIYLDKLVPKVAELALYCSDRKTRITACELLQALVILFLGTTKQMTDSGQRDLEGLLKKISFTLLDLGCDPDEVARQLFEPLFLQIVHWYSSPFQFKKCHTAVIIETLTVGICSPTNSNLRTFAGKCIGEFVKWTIKQFNETRLVDEPGNIKVFVKKMRFFSTHPDRFKKLGAALIFNNLYVFLREEREMFNMFWIEIFQIFVSALHHIDENVENETITDEIFAALKHLQRGFTEKYELFNKPNERRRKPNDFKGTLLVHVAEYLVANISSKNRICREKCTELFCNINRFIAGTKTPLKYLEYMKEPKTWLKTNFECYLEKFKRLMVTGFNQASSLLEWMSELERSLDGFLFALTNGILKEENLGMTDAYMATKFYIEKVACSDFKSTLNLVATKEWSATTAFHASQFSNKQDRINRKILKFCYHCTTHNCQITSLWTIHLWQMVTNMIFNGKLGYRGELEMFLKCCMPEGKTLELVETLRSYIEINFSKDFNLDVKPDSKRRKIMEAMFFLQNSTFNQVMDLNAVLPLLVSNFLGEVQAKTSQNSSLNLDDIEWKFYSLVLEFGLKNKEEFGRFVEYLYTSHEVQMNDSDMKIQLGLWLLNSFEETTILNILHNFDAFLSSATSQISRLELTVQYIKKILTFLHSRKRSLIQNYGRIFEKFLDVWGSFDAYFCSGPEALMEGLEIIRLVNFLNKSDFCINWLGSLVLRASKLGFLKDNVDLTVDVLELFFENYNPLNGEDSQQIRTELDQILSKIENTSDKNAQSVLIMQISKLFMTFNKSRSSLLFEFIVKAYLNFSETEEYLKDASVCQTFMINAQESEQKKVLETIVHLMKDTKYPLMRRIKLGKNILVAVFHGSEISVFEDFFVLNVKRMLEEMQQQLCENNIGKKIVDFLLVELLFARLPVGKENEVNKRLMAAAFGEDKDVKELLRCCLKYTLSAFRDNMVTSEEGQEFLRLYRCYSYNALVSIAINALNDPNFLVKLFTRTEHGEDILWKGLVDTKKTYKFEKDFNSLPQKKNILVSIKRGMDERSSVQTAAKESIRSQRIFNSSLSEDITKYDMTYVTIRQKSVNSRGYTEIALDHVDFNDHECMATICVLINHLADTVFLNSDQDCSMEDIPECLKGLRTVLMKDTTPVNVKIFLIKIIENTSHIFMYYSNYFLAPVLKFLVDKCAGDDINFFVTDMVVMLANWSEKATPSDEIEAKLATELIEFLFDKLSLERRDNFKFNIQLIKIILQAWKDVIRIPEDFLRRIETPGPLDKEIEIHLCSVLLINDLFIFENNHQTKFLKFLTNQLNSSKRSTYVPCSETLGLLLKKWNAKNIAVGYSDITEPTLRFIWDADKDKSGYILEGITIHCPGFIKENHIVRLLSRLNVVPENSQHIFLKVLLRAVGVLDGISEFKLENWERYINSASVEVQIVTLNLIMETLDILAEETTFSTLITAICEKRNSQNDLCKKFAFDILIKICTENSYNPDKFPTVVQMCKDSLIDGLSEDDPDLLSSIRNFWRDSGDLSSNLTDVFLQTVSIFYKPKNEHIFLGSGIYFLVDLIDKDEAFDNDLFDHPLEDCRFEDYELSLNPGTQHLYCVPMFAETFLHTFSTRAVPSRSEYSGLRATQDYLSFAPTLPTNKNDNERISSYISSQSQLMFDARESEDNFAFKNPNDLNNKVFKRRFLKDKSKISDLHANLQVTSNVQKSRKHISLAKERDRKVSIFRKYRKGDFPDIQIPFSSIIVPLQMLASENSDIAKIMYVEIFDNIKDKLDNLHWSRLSDTITNIFKNSVQFNTNLFRTLLDFVIISESKITLDPYLVTDTCLSSGLLSTGTLILEEYTKNMDEALEIKRARGVDSSGEEIYWIKLAELYMEMSQWDVVCSIFKEKVSCAEQLRTAISCESEKLWIDALDYYKYLIQNHLSINKRDFYYEAYFRCFANLGQWENLAVSIKTMETPDQNYWDALWDDDWKQKKLLPWLMTAEVADMLHKQELSKDFLENVNKSLCDTEKAELLKTDFPDYLALMFVVNDDMDTAEIYLESYASSFLGQWQILDPMFRSIRLDKIMKLRDCSSIYDFMDVYRKIGSVETDTVSECLRLLRVNMRQAVPHSLVRREKSLLYHKQFASLVCAKLRSLEEPDLSPCIEELNNIVVERDLDFVDAALQEYNFYLARKHVLPYRHKSGIELFPAKLKYAKARSYTRDPKMMLEVMIDSAKDIIKFDENCGKDNAFLLSAHLTLFEMLDKIGAMLSYYPDLLEAKKSFLNNLLETNVSKCSDPSDYGAQRLLHFLEGKWQAEGLSKETIADAYLKLAYYTSQKTLIPQSEFDTFVLRAMKLGSKEARQLFPCLLMQNDLGNDQVFIKESTSVPTWMFLGWVPQLLANIKSDSVQAIEPILLRIAETYPQAVMYPYRLSRKNLMKSACSTNLIEQLDNKVMKKDTDMFLKALENVVAPYSSFLYYIDRIIKYGEAGETNEMLSMYMSIREQLFECHPDSSDPDNFRGNIFKKILDHKNHFKQTSLEKKDTFIQSMRDLKVKLQNEEKKSRYSTLLRDYCPWLASFSSSRFDWEIEVPGQYDGQRKPIYQHHVKIRKFHPEVKIMESLRKPIKITIIGDDTKEYSYLLKFGEDLRQDQRIQQLFVLFNEMLAKNSDDTRQMALATFEVIPLSTNHGMIKWIDNTVSLQEFMRKAVKNKRYAKTFPDGTSKSGPLDRYYNFIRSSARGAKSDKEAFGKSAENHNRSKTVGFFRSLVNDVEQDLLRKAFWMLSTSTESFVALRHNFMRSYASMCTAHWLLGIGDRHLGNTLICLDDGRVIGIDFGHAFGTATQCLGVPELVPFRLTPQIVAFMEPFKEKGHFRESMIHTLKCLKESKKIILSTLSVFIREPSVDWLDKTRKKDEEAKEENWYPIQKIDQSKRKLEGVNPTVIMIEELELGQVKEYLNAYRCLVEGSESDYRASVDKNSLSEGEQVDCLIDQAGDYNLLGRMYFGWRPWV